MAFESSPEQPAPVRTVSRMVGEWIGRLGGVWIDGQIAELRPRPGARNIYLVLRDPDVDMSLTVVADAALIGGVTPPLEQGQRILVHAKPEYWTGRGSLQFRAKEIRPVGLGTLLEQLERLRALLAAEGVFSPERKKPLPFLPRRIGLVCGRNSAAMHDVLVNVADRWPGIPFEVREVAVQGAQAVAAVTEAVQDLDAIADVDVIVIARGGGSVEDLLPFSNESLVRAVAACITPVVSAIGHEQDAPLLDLVADFRASTPTDAAKRIVPSWQEQFGIVSALQARSSSVLRTRLDRESSLAEDLLRRVRTRVANQIESAGRDVEHLAARVRALSPAATLDRGYAIVTSARIEIIRDANEVTAGQELRIRVAKGSFNVEVRQTPAEES
ncbi:MAG: exodeoxyribonuclease VII large subunit [Actinomycetota bacterium]|nr:exodeoxyribonuclease VII large subunit [Actinomycetota bacterium]MDP2287136.1 exodeoxyribonuclease VII large subunit [Actinomycetota bacterium]